MGGGAIWEIQSYMREINSSKNCLTGLKIYVIKIMNSPYKKNKTKLEFYREFHETALNNWVVLYT